MASDRAFLDFILDRLSSLDGISYRAMMGEYILYYREKTVGGIYDNRLLIKPTREAAALMPDAKYGLPYEGAREMLLVEEYGEDFLAELFRVSYDELQAPKIKRNGGKKK